MMLNLVSNVIFNESKGSLVPTSILWSTLLSACYPRFSVAMHPQIWWVLASSISLLLWLDIIFFLQLFVLYLMTWWGSELVLKL
jgi:hypothetical protein